MSLILTSSRNPSTRVRQALKEFSRLFPKNTVKIVSRGKQSLGDLFSKYQKYNAICIVTVRYGNPDSIVSYLKINEKFVWYLELKLERILLHFELKTEEVDHPYSSQIYFVDMNNDLKLKLTRFFNTVLNMKNDPNLGDNLIKDHDLEIIFSYKNPGFSISAKLLKNKKKIKIAPRIDINEIIINDDDFTTWLTLKIELIVNLETKSSSMAKMVVDSLLIDINTTSDYFDRSDIKLSANSNIIELRIYAKDLISAKASINTSLKWIENSINIIEMFSN